jgi:hypothetical protein
MAALTCLQIIQKVCTRIGILSPNAAIGSQDPQIQQIIAISEEEGIYLSKRTDWTVLQKQAIFNTVAVESQGNINTLAPGFKFILNNTIWNRDKGIPVFGPTTPQDWQQIKSSVFTGPYNQFRIQNNLLLFVPVPQPGQECAFEYSTSNWIDASPSGGSTEKYWTNDTNIPLLSEDLIIAGTIWRWKQIKGLDYSEDYNKYERMLMDEMGRDGGKDMLDMSGLGSNLAPVVIVPIGSWNT